MHDLDEPYFQESADGSSVTVNNIETRQREQKTGDTTQSLPESSFLTRSIPAQGAIPSRRLEVSDDVLGMPLSIISFVIS